MPVGDSAQGAGYPLVPDNGEEGRVRWGAREINRTRDLVALVKGLIPTSRAGYRTASGISSGTGDPPSGAHHGDIYFKVL